MVNQIVIATVWIIVYQIIGFMLGKLHRPDIDTWYMFLRKSTLTPPEYVFGIIWPMLYICLALAGYFLWRRKASICAQVMYVVQMLLNWSWTTIFFVWHMITLSWIMIAGMILLTLLIMIESYKKAPIVTWLLVPYLGWILFAWYLNFFIWIYN